ncbi:hypothetical protein [Cryptobacterium curtum]|uniref:hypothetical protein n=1 Tax=Cryptobacterium curtum TaxID=84163 RepID=UPI00019E1EBC|nr:hypothetical protein [Cryptobacterium curtum]
MAYSDYGAFVHLNAKRRRDKEDVGVYDTDEAVFPSGVRVYANIIKNGGGKVPWYRHSQHGVMGDGDTRVACYKQGWPTIYHWEKGADKPEEFDFDKLSRMLGLDDFEEYDGTRYAPDEYDHEFILYGWRFRFWGDLNGGTPKYGAVMQRDEEYWECTYDYCYGAGFE